MPQITVLSCLRDEGPFLLEWVAFNRLIGADRMVIYTNDCRDGTDAMLDRMADMGLGILRRDNPAGPGDKPQPAALRTATRDPAVVESDWILPIDSDEFVAVKTGAGRLSDLIGAVPDTTTGIVLTWRMMGSSGLTAWNPGLVTESYPSGARDGFRRGWGVKTLFRPFPQMKLGIHRPGIKGAARNPERRAALRALPWVNGSGRPMSLPFMDGLWTSTAPTLGMELAEIAHFAVRSRESYLLRSVRGNVNAKRDKYDATYFAVFDRNETRPGHLDRHLPALRDAVADLRRDKVLRDLEARACAWHEASLERLRRQPGHAEMMERLARAQAMEEEALDSLLYLRPFGERGAAMVAQLRARNLPEAEVARRLNAAIARAEAARDARCADDLRARGLPVGTEA